MSFACAASVNDGSVNTSAVNRETKSPTGTKCVGAGRTRTSFFSPRTAPSVDRTAIPTM